ncbi:MAG: Smr/MutS family protein, partial [Saprospiraceae bacterium]|nr:Smr/MutS family protein [Saprospiraceae bacterium]
DMKAFITKSGPDTLILIDEFGSGTDPKLGGAIAEAILEQLVAKKVQGVLTTHYSELKVYAHRKKGVVNGAMVFDQETMAPSYQLSVGVPGSSFAFEIAERTGLQKAVIRYARQRAGKQSRSMEDLLIDLERQRAALESRLKSVEQKEHDLDKLVKNYERLQLDLTAQRKKFRLEQKERDYQHISQLNKELEKSVRAIREAQDLEAARKELRRIKKLRADVREEIGEMNAALAETRATDVELKVGDFVKVQNGIHTGRIERLEKDQATVIIGQLRMDVSVSDLSPAADPLNINPRASVQQDLASAPVGHFNPMLDIRGLRVDEAGDLLEKFLDGALISGTSPVRIIHGKGTGALKRVVSEKLREYPVVETRHPEDRQGGSGITIIEF